MNNWCICWFFMHIFTGILIFKGLTARRLYKSFGVKGLTYIYGSEGKQCVGCINGRSRCCNNISVHVVLLLGRRHSVFFYPLQRLLLASAICVPRNSTFSFPAVWNSECLFVTRNKTWWSVYCIVVVQRKVAKNL
jgi:hypothetical protein